MILKGSTDLLYIWFETVFIHNPKETKCVERKVQIILKSCPPVTQAEDLTQSLPVPLVVWAWRFVVNVTSSDSCNKWHVIAAGKGMSCGCWRNLRFQEKSLSKVLLKQINIKAVAQFLDGGGGNWLVHELNKDFEPSWPKNQSWVQNN